MCSDSQITAVNHAKNSQNCQREILKNQFYKDVLYCEVKDQYDWQMEQMNRYY